METQNIPLEERVARVAHEANRGYCQSIGDYTQPEWLDAPDWQRESAINGVQFHFNNHRQGITPNPAASHEAWLEQKRKDGWTYGPVKDPTLKQHPCFMPYDGLPIEQRMKDYIFSAICEAFYKGMTAEAGFVPSVVGGAS